MSTIEKIPSKVKQAVTIAQDRLRGDSYREIAKKRGVSIATVSRVLNKDEIKDVIDQGLVEMISRVPDAIQCVDKTLRDYRLNAALAYKASEFILKTATIAPSTVENQTINNIVNVQNNITLSQAVAKSIQGMFNHNDDDIIEVDGEINE